MSVLYGRAPVVVGVDGSAASDAALDRALRAAQERCVPLRVLHVVEDHLSDGRRVLDAAQARVRAQGGVAEAVFDLRAGSAAVALGCAASGAALLVLGAGPVAEEVAGGIDAPLLAVRPRPQGGLRSQGRVVAALDATPRAVHALAFALEEADLLGARLRVVHVDQGATSRELPLELAALVELWASKFPEVGVETRLRAGDPVETLVHSAMDADLLVVAVHPVESAGTLGPVGIGVLRRAGCDVALV